MVSSLDFITAMSEPSFVPFDKMWAEKWPRKLSQSLLVRCESVFGKPLHSELSDSGVLFTAVQVLCALVAPPGKSRTNYTWIHFWLSLLTHWAEFGNLKQLRTPSKVWLLWTEASEQRNQSHFKLLTLSPPVCIEAFVISANPKRISWIF